MKLKTIAEFAENEGVLMALERAGVDYAQGIAIAAPRPLHEVLEEELQRLQGDRDVEATLPQIAAEWAAE